MRILVRASWFGLLDFVPKEFRKRASELGQAQFSIGSLYLLDDYQMASSDVSSILDLLKLFIHRIDTKRGNKSPVNPI